MTIRKKAFAKINLTLDLTCILPDGYHGIFTVMQSVGLCDNVTVTLQPSGGIVLECSDKSIPCDSRNTAYKAAEYYLAAANETAGVNIYIEKNIPSQAGLAGGSADAAAVLDALNGAFPGRVTEAELYAIALKVGADVPFCLAGGTRLCQNKGEVMTSLPEFASHVVLVKPKENVSTKDAYARFDSSSDIPHPDNGSYLFYAARGEHKSALSYADNIFERLTDVPSGKKIKDILLSSGSYHAAMSGSGSAFFGLFDLHETAVAAAERLGKSFGSVWVCETTNTGTAPFDAEESFSFFA